MTLRNFSLVFSASASHPPIHPRLAVLSFISLVIDINDTEQQDTTVFFHPRSGACFFTDQCPVSSILIRLYIVYPWGQMESLYTRTHTHVSQASFPALSIAWSSTHMTWHQQAGIQCVPPLSVWLCMCWLRRVTKSACDPQPSGWWSP